MSVVEGEEPFIALAMYPSLLVAATRGVGMAWFRLEPLAVLISLSFEFNLSALLAAIAWVDQAAV